MRTPSRKKSLFAWLLGTATPILLLGGSSAMAQAPEQELRELAKRQQVEIAQQRALMIELQRKVESLEQSRRQTPGTPPSPRPPDSDVEQRVDRLHAEVQRLERAREDQATQAVTGGSFPGSLKIPGSDASIKLGGYVKLDAIYDVDDIGSEDTFAPGAIRTDGSDRSGRTRLHAKQTRLNFDVRKSSELGDARIFLEGDFFGAGGNQNSSNSTTFRLRHAFGELGRLTAGQTWSTFMDVSVLPDTLDFQGVNSSLFVRQAQVRWTQPLDDGLTLAAAIENPEGDVSGPGGDLNLDRFPDAIVRLRWDRDWGHLQTAALAREIAVDDGNRADSEFGYGLTLSGSLRLPDIHVKDRVAFQLAVGEGVGRYVTELGGSGFDARRDADGNLDTAKVFGAMIQGQHWWSDSVRSTVAYGFLKVDGGGDAPGDTLETSQYAAINLVWSPVPSVDLGVEYLWGALEVEDGRSGRANRFQASATWRF